jgi:hypothetical protein
MSFVVWFNFLAGFTYVIAGVGCVAAAVGGVVVFLIAGFPDFCHLWGICADGGNYSGTVAAMSTVV